MDKCIDRCDKLVVPDVGELALIYILNSINAIRAKPIF